MCGIIGYLGKQEAEPIILEGLKRLEYRGYDSSGLSVGDKNKITMLKSVGPIENLEKLIATNALVGNWGIGHTRWATHGAVTQENAHPHTDCQKNIFLVHNGIIENYQQLKEQLIKEGHRFVSETDTEVIVHLIEKFFQGNLEKAVIQALKLIKGTYALVVISRDDPEKIVVAKKSSPVLIGLNGNEYIIASDPSAIVSYTKKIIYLDDDDVAVVTKNGIHFTNLNYEILTKKTQTLEWNLNEAQKGGYPHFMLKEIMEQPQSIKNSLAGRVIEKDGIVKLGGLENIKARLQEIKRLIIVACGSSYFAGLVGEYLLEEYAGIPTKVEYASEFRYRQPVLDKETAVLFISQSGETADTLAALREVKRRGVLTLGIVNVVGSSISRETDAGIYNHIGPEIGVATTKAFTSQLVILVLITLFFGRERQMSFSLGQAFCQELYSLPALAEKILAQRENIENLAQKYKKYHNFLYLGRKYNYPLALEGALKLKEIAYLHAEGYSAGEMKHGPIALIDKNFPTVGIVFQDSVYKKTISNLEEIKTRQGPILALATEGDEEIKKITHDVIYLPKIKEPLMPILAIIPLQLLAYYLGVSLGYDVDKPRNLAKSVTVE